MMRTNTFTSGEVMQHWAGEVPRFVFFYAGVFFCFFPPGIQPLNLFKGILSKKETRYIF